MHNEPNYINLIEHGGKRSYNQQLKDLKKPRPFLSEPIDLFPILVVIQMIFLAYILLWG